MTRRGIFGLLAASLTLDPEKLLWVPGAKLISIPKPSVQKGNRFLTLAEITQIVREAMIEVDRRDPDIFRAIAANTLRREG